ncbi:uncharacterized protein LOC141850533 [Brevipalpus obovatus]|uniref:uncharacterized protein LOC141850533 n=1 Tax=Brevipalpus obovatus TaxID=246614 RepID=UPI003D9FA3E2
MCLILLFLLPVFVECTQFDFPIEGPEKANLINSRIFLPCFKGVFDEEYGYFEPLTFVIYPFTFLPISVCPQLSSKKTLRCLAISKMEPNKIVPCGEIEPKSKVCIHIHAYQGEYDETLAILTALTCLRDNDWAVLVDWARMAAPRVFSTIRLPVFNLLLALTNPILNGRITCKLVRYLNKVKKVKIKDIFVVGLSAGSQFLSPMADYCREKYDIHFNHMVALDLPFLPYRRSNYPLVNRTSAKFVDVIFTTIAPDVPQLDGYYTATMHVGYLEVDANCVYYVNPERILLEQEPCVSMPGSICSHVFSVLVYVSAYSGRCLYRYGPCPDKIIPLNTSREVGSTRLNCADHPFLGRTCITTSSNPLISC